MSREWVILLVGAIVWGVAAGLLGLDPIASGVIASIGLLTGLYSERAHWEDLIGKVQRGEKP